MKRPKLAEKALKIILQGLKGFSSRITPKSGTQVAKLSACLSESMQAQIPKKIFLGLSEHKINEIAKNTPRGVKAIIHKDAVEYFYKSASGKMINSVLIESKPDGGLKYLSVNGSNFTPPNSPIFFCEKLYDAINENSQE